MRIRDIKIEAKERFALNRYQAMLIYGVVYTLALNIAVLTTTLCLLNKWAVWYGVILIFLFLLLLAPFNYGMTGFYLRLYRFEKIDASSHVFDGFNKYNLERMIVLRLLSFVLWLAFTVLLIVPGIIFSVRTSMATYLLRANPKMKPQDALRASNKIMKKHCWKYFGLSLSYIGWFFMGLVTCGLGYIWVLPYCNAAKIVFYKRELQGDKTVYRNPDENADSSAPQDKQPNAEELAMQSPLHSVTQELSVSVDDTAETDIPILTDEAESERIMPITTEEDTVWQEMPVVDMPLAEEEPPPEVVASNRAVRERGTVRPTAITTDRPRRDLQHAERRPLPGGRVIMDNNGRRVIADRRSATATPEENNERRTGNGSTNKQIKTDESVRARIERLRAERMAGRANGTASSRRSGGTSEKNTDIGEEK